MDFGLSCVHDTATMSCPDYYIQTRYYRSPEVMLAIPYTTASDMWSLGVIVGEFFRGTEFIFGETEPDQMAAIMENIGLPPVSFIEQSDRRHIYYGKCVTFNFNDSSQLTFRSRLLRHQAWFSSTALSKKHHEDIAT